MSHARIEEVEDSDVDMSDPSEGDIDDFAETDIMRRVVPSKEPAAAPPPPRNVSSVPPPFQGPPPAAYAGYQCLYPVYFDAGRTRAEGRRVSREQAVENPLAADIAAACQKLRLAPIFEPTKLHPKDWSNPGRVRVLLRENPAKNQASNAPGVGVVANGAAAVKNKHHLYLLIAEHLRANPTTEASQSLRTRLPGAPPPPPFDKPYPRPAVPRGWKINDLLPYYSPAMTGGGVSENLFKDMMREMQGGGDMASLLSGAAGGGNAAVEEKKKKDKKGKGKG
jgi:signal recognition particle subunit SRP19